MSIPQPLLEELGNGAAWIVRHAIAELRVRTARSNAQQPADTPPVPTTPPWDQRPPWEGKAPPWGASDQPQQAPSTVTPAAPPPAPAADVASSYSAEMDEDATTACINCTRRHLWEMRVAGQKAAEAAAAGDDLEARRRLRRVVGEGLALKQYDWKDEKLAKVKPREGKAIAAAAPHVDAVLQNAPQPPQQLALAWSSLDEAMRFARSPRPTPRDHREIAERLDEAGAMISDCESEVLPRLASEDRQWMEQVLPDLRVIRQAAVEHLNGRQPMTKDEIDAATSYLHAVAVELTPTPDVETAKAVAQTAAQAEKDFKQALFSLGEVG